MKPFVLCAGMLLCATGYAQQDPRDSDRRSDRERRSPHHHHAHQPAQSTGGAPRAGAPDPYAPKVGAPDAYAPRAGDPDPYAPKAGAPNPYATRGGDPAPQLQGTGSGRRR